MVIIDGINMRLGTSGLGVTEIMRELLQRNDPSFTLEALIAQPEQDTWE